MFYTTIGTSKEQAEALYNKHLKPIVKKKFWSGKKFIVPRILSFSFAYDDEDGIGFVTLKTITGKKVEYQLRSGQPMFVEFTGFGNIRYDISYPDHVNRDLYNILKEYGKKASDNFWKGGEI